MTQLPAAFLELDPDYAVRSYYRDPDFMFKTGMGGVINAAALLLAAMFANNPWFIPAGMVVGAFVSGYQLRTAHSRIDDPRSNLPEWNVWGDLLFGGLTWIAIQFAWNVLAAMPITFALIMTIVGLSMYSNSIPTVVVLMATMLLVVLFVTLGTHFLLSYLMLNFAKEERLPAAFNFIRVLTYLMRYPRQMLTAWMIALEMQVFAVILPAVTVIGVFLIPSTLFSAQLIGITIMAQVWRAALEEEKYAPVPVANKVD